MKFTSTRSAKIGGKYYHLMTLENIGDMPVDGRITEYEPPAKLAYAVKDPGGSVSTVTVEFLDRDGRTEVRLVHDNIPGEYAVHVKAGWTAALGKLERLLTAEAAEAQ